MQRNAIRMDCPLHYKFFLAIFVLKLIHLFSCPPRIWISNHIVDEIVLWNFDLLSVLAMDCP
jgi:hypothetical protein